MNIVLTALNAKYIHSSLSLRCLKSAAKAEGFNVDTAEFTINNTRNILPLPPFRNGVLSSKNNPGEWWSFTVLNVLSVTAEKFFTIT